MNSAFRTIPAGDLIVGDVFIELYGSIVGRKSPEFPAAVQAITYCKDRMTVRIVICGEEYEWPERDLMCLMCLDFPRMQAEMLEIVETL